MAQDLKPGDRVRTPNGDVGRVRSVDGRHATVDEESGYGWRGLVEDLVRMETTMAQPGSLKVGDTVRENRQGAETGKVVDVRDNMITVRYRRQGGGAHDEDFHVTKLVKMSMMERSIQDLVDEYKRLNRALATCSDQDAPAIRRKRDQVQAEIEKRGGPKGFDLTEVEVGADGSVDVCVDPSGDEAGQFSTMDSWGTDANGKTVSVGDTVVVPSEGVDGRVERIKGDTFYVKVAGSVEKYTRKQIRAMYDSVSQPTVIMERQAACPYCRKTVAMDRGAIGYHRSAVGVCLGAGKSVARVEQGRAVLMSGLAGFPNSVQYRGRTYYSTGKTGTRRRDGKQVAEYSARDANDREIGRVWADATGREIEED